jgi:two-component system CheB/CheR fusion protein
MGQQFSSRKILVVDDNQDAAEMVAALLRAYGHSAEVAFGGQAALDALAEFAPDVVFLDIGMPGMDGYDTIAALRASAVGGRARVGALTAWNDEVSRRGIAEAGFDMHLTKPAGLESLLRECSGEPKPGCAADNGH